MRRVLLLALTACAAPPPEPPSAPPAPVVATSTPSPPHGSRYVATEDVIGLEHPMPMPTILAEEGGRHLRLAGRNLYWFDRTASILRLLELDRGAPPRTVVELAAIDHPRFPSTDPLASLHRQEDLAIEGGVLCLDLHDRPDQPTATYNIRVDLATGTQVRHLVLDLGGDNCGVEREAERPRLCTPAGPSTLETRDGTEIPIALVAVVPLER